MDLRSFRPSDLDALIALTIDTFGPFYEESFHSIVGDRIFRHQHGGWKEDHRREGVATALYDAATEAMRQADVAVVALGTGGDPFHQPARAFYESKGMIPVPGVYYFQEL